MASRSQLKRQAEAAVSKWNKANPVGTPVVVHLDNVDGGAVLETTTRSEAKVLSGHTAVVWLNSLGGCYDLKRVRRLQPVAEMAYALRFARSVLVHQGLFDLSERIAVDVVDRALAAAKEAGVITEHTTQAEVA